MAGSHNLNARLDFYSERLENNPFRGAIATAY